MKETVFTLAVLCLIGVLPAKAERYSYYHGGGKEIPLNVDSQLVSLRFTEGLSLADQPTLLSAVERIICVVPDSNCIDGFIVCSLQVDSGYTVFLDSLSSVEGIAYVEPYYVGEYGHAMLVGREFCVRFSDELSRAAIDSINSAMGAVVARDVEGMNNTFVLHNLEGSGRRLVDLANEYFDLDQTVYGHPFFGVWIEQHWYTLLDYYADYQDHSKKVIGQFNFASVWDFAGIDSPVVVAVIDDGVVPHEDLPATRLLPGRDFAEGDFDPSPGSARAHGMACAGIIAASHSIDGPSGMQPSSGVFGIDPLCNILPVKIFDDDLVDKYISEDSIAAAIVYAYTRGAAILSNSWGFRRPEIEYDVINDALDRAHSFGRNGLGCAIFFSSGNSDSLYYGVGWPARREVCFAVGALQLNDERWPYSQRGPALDITAPSGNTNLNGDVWSLDQMGAEGWNPFRMSDCPPEGNDADYDCHMGGTSAACPIVAGTAALLLSKDPNLSAQAIYYILRNSAQRDLDWGTVTTVPDPQYGYGRVDAFRAVSSLCHGDADNNGTLNVSDLSYLIAYLQQGGPAPFPCAAVADVNCDDAFNISDITYMVAALFQGGPPPVKPCFTFDNQ